MGDDDGVLELTKRRRCTPRIDRKTGNPQYEEAREERPRSSLTERPQLHETVAREGRTQSVLPERPQLYEKEAREGRTQSILPARQQLYGIAAHESEGPED